MASGSYCGHTDGGHMFRRKPDPYLTFLRSQLAELEAMLARPRAVVRLTAGDCQIPDGVPCVTKLTAPVANHLQRVA
jgi:hypothetical protein